LVPQYGLLLLLLLLLLTAIELSLGGGTDKTSKKTYTYKRDNTKNPVQTKQNTVNTSTHITKTYTHYKTS
jgi:hypothetical protein